ncbi:MAG: YggS family pyridoxal phosphate-dependent enzyme [Cyanobacteria bacterium P01_A01_bin.17]
MTDSGKAVKIAEQIAAISKQLPPQTRLVAVTKKVSVPAMRQAYQAGIRDFGESRIQELEAKQAEMEDLRDVTWHFIGHLQRNKAKRAVELCQWIHSVDSLALARRLNQLAADRPQQPRICLQVKILDDPDKYGWSVADLKTELSDLMQCNFLDFRGLMTILPLGLSEEEQLSAFKQVRTLAEQLTQQTDRVLNLQELSMGMSGDYQLAVQAGSTLVRVGRLLFGER